MRFLLNPQKQKKKKKPSREGLGHEAGPLGSGSQVTGQGAGGGESAQTEDRARPAGRRGPETPALHPGPLLSHRRLSSRPLQPWPWPPGQPALCCLSSDLRAPVRSGSARWGGPSFSCSQPRPPLSRVGTKAHSGHTSRPRALPSPVLLVSSGPTVTSGPVTAQLSAPRTLHPRVPSEVLEFRALPGSRAGIVGPRARRGGAGHRALGLPRRDKVRNQPRAPGVRVRGSGTLRQGVCLLASGCQAPHRSRHRRRGRRVPLVTAPR